MIATKKRLSKKEKEAKAEKFIKGAGRAKNPAPKPDVNKNGNPKPTPVMMKIAQPHLEKIDATAESLRLNRTAFMLTCAQIQIEKLAADPVAREEFQKLAYTNWIQR